MHYMVYSIIRHIQGGAPRMFLTKEVSPQFVTSGAAVIMMVGEVVEGEWGKIAKQPYHTIYEYGQPQTCKA